MAGKMLAPLPSLLGKLDKIGVDFNKSLSEYILLPMLKTKSRTLFISSTLLSFVLATFTAQVAQAQRAGYLLKSPCVNAGPGNWGENNLNVSIGKAVYRSFFYMGAGDQFASMTCKIASANAQPVFQTLRLGFGMGDIARRSPANIVNVYLDGKQIVTRTIAPGEKDTLSIDVSNVSNVAIETICSSQSQYCDRVYFFDASLDRTTTPPTQTHLPLRLHLPLRSIDAGGNLREWEH